MALSCEGCGVTYEREPALEVACPTCHAAVGRPCVARRPSGHVHSAAYAGLPPWGHDARDLLAAASGAYRCACGITPDVAARRLAAMLETNEGTYRAAAAVAPDLFTPTQD